MPEAFPRLLLVEAVASGSAAPLASSPSLQTKTPLSQAARSAASKVMVWVKSSPGNWYKNQMTWRVVERVDGQPWLEKAVTLQDGTSTVSPFVVLN